MYLRFDTLVLTADFLYKNMHVTCTLFGVSDTRLTFCGACGNMRFRTLLCFSPSKRCRVDDGVPSSAADDAAADGDADASSRVVTEARPPET